MNELKKKLMKKSFMLPILLMLIFCASANVGFENPASFEPTEIVKIQRQSDKLMDWQGEQAVWFSVYDFIGEELDPRYFIENKIRIYVGVLDDMSFDNAGLANDVGTELRLAHERGEFNGIVLFYAAGAGSLHEVMLDFDDPDRYIPDSSTINSILRSPEVEELEHKGDYVSALSTILKKLARQLEATRPGGTPPVEGTSEAPDWQIFKASLGDGQGQVLKFEDLDLEFRVSEEPKALRLVFRDEENKNWGRIYLCSGDLYPNGCRHKGYYADTRNMWIIKERVTIPRMPPGDYEVYLQAPTEALTPTRFETPLDLQYTVINTPPVIDDLTWVRVSNGVKLKATVYDPDLTGITRMQKIIASYEVSGVIKQSGTVDCRMVDAPLRVCEAVIDTSGIDYGTQFIGSMKVYDGIDWGREEGAEYTLRRGEVIWLDTQVAPKVVNQGESVKVSSKLQFDPNLGSTYTIKKVDITVYEPLLQGRGRYIRKGVYPAFNTGGDTWEATIDTADYTPYPPPLNYRVDITAEYEDQWHRTIESTLTNADNGFRVCGGHIPCTTSPEIYEGVADEPVVLRTGSGVYPKLNLMDSDKNIEISAYVLYDSKVNNAKAVITKADGKSKQEIWLSRSAPNTWTGNFPLTTGESPGIFKVDVIIFVDGRAKPSKYIGSFMGYKGDHVFQIKPYEEFGVNGDSDERFDIAFIPDNYDSRAENKFLRRVRKILNEGLLNLDFIRSDYQHYKFGDELRNFNFWTIPIFSDNLCNLKNEEFGTVCDWELMNEIKAKFPFRIEALAAVTVNPSPFTLELKVYHRGYYDDGVFVIPDRNDDLALIAAHKLGHILFGLSDTGCINSANRPLWEAGSCHGIYSQADEYPNLWGTFEECNAYVKSVIGEDRECKRIVEGKEFFSLKPQGYRDIMSFIRFARGLSANYQFGDAALMRVNRMTNQIGGGTS